MTDTVVVRDARMDDIPWLISQLRDFEKFCARSVPLADYSHLETEFLPMLIRGHILIVADVDGKQAGFVGAFVTGSPLNPSLTVVSEVFAWVDPSFRGQRIGSLLLDRYIELGKSCSQMVTFVLLEGSPMREEALIDRGFKRSERVYTLEVA